MNNELFQVKPVASYAEARYPSTYQPEVEAEASEERAHPVVMFLAMLLVLGLTLGFYGCYMRTEYSPPGDPVPDGGGDPPDPDCEDGQLRCAEAWTLEVCLDETWVARDCNTYCAETYGVGYTSYGCDAEAADPCQCEYDIMEGVMIECTPDEIQCLDDETIEYCEYDMYVVENCNDYCRDHFGSEYISWGCDDTAEDPCMCDYDILEGEPMECTPGEIVCWDDETLGTCLDGWTYDLLSCDDYCIATYGSGYYSTGCDIEAADPCGCEAPDSGSGGE